MSEVVRWYDNSIYLKASFHDLSFTFILFFIFRGKFQLAKEEDIVEKSVLSQRELCKSMASRLPNFNGVWLKPCHEQYFFKILYSYLCHGQFLRIYFFVNRK